ncbi:MAG: CBS domain-containing protein, partial [Gammaproteobacteria bacterium]|nr:CBS domain-containing protein [Gammaproteobacteria bacterium]
QTLISAADLDGQTQRLRDDAQTDKIDIDEIDIVLNDIPAASRIRPLIISSRATLHDALAQLNQLKDRSVYALCIVVRGDAGSERLTGILTRRDIENYYQI